MKQFRSLCLMAAAATMFLATAPAAQAAPVLYANFCPGNASCPAGLTEASLAFYEDGATADTNDYRLFVTFSGNALAPAYLDQFQFTITGVSTPGGYASLPSVLNAPAAGATWMPFFSNINASAGSCTANTNNSQGVCVQSGPGSATNYGAPLTSNTLTFELYVDLAGSFMLNQDMAVNLRAQFLNSNGSNAGILSPDFNRVPPPPDSDVPEPTSMVLLGLGLIGAGVARRRRQL